MKDLVNRPMFLAALLAIPLWIVLGNFVVAAMVALLVSFLASMVHALRVIKRKQQQAADTTPDRNDKKAYDQ